MKAHISFASAIFLGLATADESESGSEQEYPKFKTTDVTIIPEGATEHNAIGYWLEGSYSTKWDAAGATPTWEIALNLHSPQQELDAVYMTWAQFEIPLPAGTERKPDEPVVLEGFTCPLVFNKSALEKVSVTNTNIKGYRGTDDLFIAQGNYSKLLVPEG